MGLKSVPEQGIGMDIGSLAATSLPETVKTLIEKVAEAAHVIYEPTQIRRKARAEADAAMIRATSELEIDEMQRRALTRLAIEEASNQTNMEAILDKALKLITDGATPENLDNDWVRRFFDRSRLISSDDVQEIWAKLLAGEADAPGTYSKRAIDILDSLDSKDVRSFTALCSFAVDLGRPTPLIYDLSDPIYSDNGLDLYSVSTLESVGLIHQSIGYSRGGLKKSGRIRYFEEALYVELKEQEAGSSGSNTFRMNLGQVIVSEAGRELQQFVTPQAVEGFPDYLRIKWREFGYLTEPAA